MVKHKTSKRRISEQIRRLVELSGLSRYEIWMQTDIDQATMSKFMAGSRGLSMKALDRLGEFLNLEIVMHGPNEQPKKGK